MRWFTSDTHFGDPRLNLYQRDLMFRDPILIDLYIKLQWNNMIKNDDTIYHIGDVAYTEEGLEMLGKLNGKKVLITGNYDEDFHKRGLLDKYFDQILSASMITLENGRNVYMTHKPTNAQENTFNLVGHVHGLWQSQRNMINISSDAWNFAPVSEQMVIDKIEAIENYYDDNVFAGELVQNLNHTPKKILKKMKKFIDKKLSEEKDL